MTRRRRRCPPGPTMAGPLLVWESGATLSVHGLTVAHSGSRPIQCRLAAATSGRARARWFGAPWHLWVRTREAADFRVRGGRTTVPRSMEARWLETLRGARIARRRAAGFQGNRVHVRDPRRQPLRRGLRRAQTDLPGDIICRTYAFAEDLARAVQSRAPRAGLDLKHRRMCHLRTHSSVGESRGRHRPPGPTAGLSDHALAPLDLPLRSVESTVLKQFMSQLIDH